jgi:RHS repeat-associated protein
LVGWAWRNGDAASRTFDTDGRMTHSEIASYSYDAASRITGISQSLWAERTVTTVVNGKTQTTTELYPTPISWTAGYDARNRLTSFTRAGAETRYSYDANSNRLTAIDTTSSEVDLEGAFDQPSFTQSASQSLNVDAASNKLLGFTQTITKTQAGHPVSSVTSNVNYSIDANGAMTSDGLRTFEYDESRRLAKVKIVKDGEAAAVEYLHNALGQRVFKSEPQAEQTLPQEEDLGPGFMNWLKKSFGWMFTKGSGAKASIGMAFVYGDEEIPQWALLGEYDNGSALGKGRTEYIWLPTESGQAIPVGMYRNGRFYAIHADHLGTPRLMTDSANKPVWQWAYSAFGSNKPSGVAVSGTAATGQAMLKASKPNVELDLRFPGQLRDEETGTFYNFFRDYDPFSGRYRQGDPIGLGGGLNRFSYAQGNPILYSDATGLRVELRCRPVGNPLSEASLQAKAARLLGGEHCYLVVHCPEAKLDLVTVSYLGSGMAAVPRNSGVNNDTVYSDMFNFRANEVSEQMCHKDQCAIERCIVEKAGELMKSGYRVPNYSALSGPNSNSVAKRLLEMCGGKASGTPPPTGWDAADKVGF